MAYVHVVTLSLASFTKLMDSSSQGHLPLTSLPGKTWFLLSFLSYCSALQVAIQSRAQRESKKKLASFGTLNPGGNFRTEATLRTRQKSLRSQSDFPSMPPLGVQSSASAASPGCHLLAKERNEQGPVGVDCGHRAVSCSSKRTQGAPRTAVG